MSITASEARQRLFPLIEEVNDDQVAVEIVSKKGTAFLVSADEYRSLKETVYLLQSPRNAERLRESIAQLRAGDTETHEFTEWISGGHAAHHDAPQVIDASAAWPERLGWK